MLVRDAVGLSAVHFFVPGFGVAFDKRQYAVRTRRRAEFGSKKIKINRSTNGGPEAYPPT
jgi:hypothetical protein